MVSHLQIIELINVISINLFILSIPSAIVLIVWFIYLMNKNSIEYTGYSIFHHRVAKIIPKESPFLENLPKYD